MATFDYSHASDAKFNIIDGQSHCALLRSFPVNGTEAIKCGEWVVFNNDGTVSKQVGVYDGVKKAYPVIGGNTDRFDSRTMGSVTLCLGTFHADTSMAEAVTINAGDRLTLKDGVLTKAGATPAPLTIVGECVKPNVNGKLEFVRQ